MSQETTDKAGYLILAYSQANQTVVSMTEVTMIEA
jgi:hypothetical protein